LIIIEEELRAFVARDARIFLDTFEKLKNENRVLTNVLNETNDKIQDIKQIFRDLNAQETIVIQKKEEILQEKNEILKQRDMLKKKLEKTRTVNEYFITREITSASESALAFKSNFRQLSVKSQKSTYSMTSSSTAFIKLIKISDSLVYKNNKNKHFNA
jgi:endo-alpha-1,4-polygalactosaminidase (GH114 family)